MRVSIATALVVGAAGVFAGCGSEAADAPVAVPSSGTAYRAMNDSERLAVAASCRDRAAARADGVAADELGRVDARALREQLDVAFRLTAKQRRPVVELLRRAPTVRDPRPAPELRRGQTGRRRVHLSDQLGEAVDDPGCGFADSPTRRRRRAARVREVNDTQGPDRRRRELHAADDALAQDGEQQLHRRRPRAAQRPSKGVLQRDLSRLSGRRTATRLVAIGDELAPADRAPSTRDAEGSR